MSLTMTGFTLAAIISAVLLLSASLTEQTRHYYPLESPDGLVLRNLTATMAVLHGKKGLRLTHSDETRRAPFSEEFATLPDLVFSNGVIEVELAGAPQPEATDGARGFVGIAFRVQKDDTFDAFYLRPTNGRVDDQERRNHAVQYISHPEWPWPRLRKETPGKYESYVDLIPGEWTKIKIDVRGDTARLYVHDAEQPTLIVNDVKSGAFATGRVALWVGAETVAHFRSLTVTRRD
jgi:hypothetical protein